MKPELLAPAGDLERLKYALIYGADAVYIGGVMFGLRANATNFDLIEMKEAVKFAHNLNKRVYVTVNIALHNKEAELLVDYLKQLDEINIDAIIVSDPAILKIAKENTKLDIYISTQQSTLNYEAVLFWKKLGAKRIILGREATKEEIKEIIEKTDIPIECFIHGAMCAGYSGRCVLSNYFSKRDANRGGCSQVCRWSFDLLDENKKILNGDKDFTFCTKDLSMLKNLKEMIDIGVTSLKIEGRMRSIYYIATVVSIYRKAIDEYFNNKQTYEYNSEYEKVLNRCANRDSICQFFDGKYDSSCNYYNNSIEVSNQDFLGVVLDYQDNMVTIEQRNYFKKGDIVEIFGPNEVVKFKINALYDIDNNEIEVANKPKEIIKIPLDIKVNKCDLMRVNLQVDKMTNL